MTKPKFELVPTITWGNVITLLMVAVTAIWWGAGINGRVLANENGVADSKAALSKHEAENIRQMDKLERTISEGFREQKQDTKDRAKRIDAIADGR